MWFSLRLLLLLLERVLLLLTRETEGNEEQPAGGGGGGSDQKNSFFFLFFFFDEIVLFVVDREPLIGLAAPLNLCSSSSLSKIIIIRAALKRIAPRATAAATWASERTHAEYLWVAAAAAERGSKAANDDDDDDGQASLGWSLNIYGQQQLLSS